MSLLTTFDSTKESLQDLLRAIRDGKIQLPDFQRGWIWDDQHIRDLLASISRAYPIGAVMMLQTGNPNVRFQPRTVEGVSLANGVEPERLILDGQQRLTSLFQALLSENVVETRDERRNRIRRWYYIDLSKALDASADREEAIVGLPEDRTTRNFRGEVVADYSTTDKECAAGFLPARMLLDTAGLTSWQMHYINHDPTRIAERLATWNRVVNEIVQPFQQYQIPLIVLRKETPKEAVCQVFEKVNTGGVALDAFELLTATFAADNFKLRDDWETRDKRFRKFPALASIAKTDFLQAVSLLVTRARREAAIAAGTPADKAPGISCKKKEILDLTLDEYRTWADAATRGFEKAARLLRSQHLFTARDLPYRTQLTPLAAILAVLGDKAEAAGMRDLFVRWYWCGVMGELYGGAIETRFARDLAEVLAWVDGGKEPSTVADANFVSARLLTLKTRNSAAYKGISALLMRDGGRDFRTGEELAEQFYFDDHVDIHHIFPKAWCHENRVDERRMDSVVNKTPLSAKTNRMIGSNAPSVYLERMQRSAGVDAARMDEIVHTHLADPALLRSNDFDAFFRARSEALLTRIEQAMGKKIARDAAASIEGEDGDSDDTDEVEVS
jgi:hypothetical protein